MSPRRAHRRARRRSSARPVLLLVAAVIVVALVVGGLTQVSRQSAGYDANSNRTLASLGSIVADQSNASAAEVRTLVAHLPSQSRQVLQENLDSAVRQDVRRVVPGRPGRRRRVAAVARRPGSPRSSPNGRRRWTDLRTAVDGFLGLHPELRPPAAQATGCRPPWRRRRPPCRPPGRATGSPRRRAVRRADAPPTARCDDRSARQHRGRTAGFPPRSGSATPRTGRLGTVAATVDLMATSSTLAVTHNLVLRTVRLNPPALPTPTGHRRRRAGDQPGHPVRGERGGGQRGLVDERRASVRISLANQTTRGDRHPDRTPPSVALGATVGLPPVTFGVKPGTTYVLTI